MAGLKITITNAGRAEIINADNTGTGPVVIAEVGFGTGSYDPDPAQTQLVTEAKRLSTIAGQVVADDAIHVTIRDDSSDAYDVNEVGLYTGSGTLFAVYSQAAGNVLQKAAASSLLLAVDIVLDTLDAASISFGDTSFAMPDASETVKGVVELADEDETVAGEEDNKAVSPKHLKKALDKARVLGEPFWHLGDVPPDGALLFAGQLLGRADYPELWAALNAAGRNVVFVSDADYLAGRRGYWSLGDGSTTFRAPDPRGLALRVWDNGAGVDVGRVSGSFQDDAIRNITGHLSSETGNESLFLDEPNNILGGGALSASVAQTGLSGGTSIANGGTGRFEFDASKVVPTANENRMKNISWPLAFWYE